MRMEWIVPGLESPRCEAVRGTSCGEHWHWHRCNVAHVCQCLMAVDRETCLRRWLLCDGKGFTRRTHVLLQHDRPDLQAIVHWQMRCLPNMPLPLMMAARRPSLTRWQLPQLLPVRYCQWQWHRRDCRHCQWHWHWQHCSWLAHRPGSTGSHHACTHFQQQSLNLTHTPRKSTSKWQC